MPRRGWEIPEREVTPEDRYVHRRKFLRTIGGIGAGLFVGCGHDTVFEPREEESPEPPAPPGEPAPIPFNRAAYYPARANPTFSVPDDRPVTMEETASTHNNFYEFTTTKAVHRFVDNFSVDPWTVEISGLVPERKVYDIGQLHKLLQLEERIYRHRCVEAWSMTVPWTGFLMRDLIDLVQPFSAARYVAMTTFFLPEVAKGQWQNPDWPWAYTEGLTMEEATNDLTMLATGIYGHELPVQHGAPLRLVVPWKYGYKSVKSIVQITFTDTQPQTFWNILWPTAYPFESNVNPAIPHPAWSQKKELLLDGGSRDTVIYNGYGEYVAHLYA